MGRSEVELENHGPERCTFLEIKNVELLIPGTPICAKRNSPTDETSSGRSFMYTRNTSNGCPRVLLRGT